MTGYDEAVPAGRDLTAQDVRDALAQSGLVETRWYGAAKAARHLNRIARPAARSVSPDAAPATTETSAEHRIPEREWQRREVMFLAREVVKYRDDPTTWLLKLDQLAAAF